MRLRVGLLALAATTPALGGSLDLAHYQVTGTHPLPAVAAAEASAVTWNWDADTLFVLGDEGEALVEVSKTGQQISAMTLTGFDDTEGLTYVGNGKFVLVEERLQDLFLLTYSAGGSVDRSALASVSLGATVGNIGIEGVALDRISGKYIAVKEKTPQQVLEATADFVTPAVTVGDLFVPNLGLLDLSDVQTLSAIPPWMGGPDAANLLIYSQESARLLEVSRSGQVLSQMSLVGVADNIEGVTVDGNGVIYLVGEDPTLFVLTPEPASALLLGAAVLALALRRRV